MRLRLAVFDGLRIPLAAGWYELPGHVTRGERMRLMELLAATLGCCDILECELSDLERTALGIGRAVVHVVLPPSIADPAQRLRPYVPRLGLFTVEGSGRWPEYPWDERDVKGALSTWLRRSFRREDHPLAGAGIASFPLHELIAATSEPIELIILVEEALACGSRLRALDETIDWARCVRWSLARRLAARLGQAPAGLRPLLARTIESARDGALSMVDPTILEELARLGLAHVAGYDAMLVPLARTVAQDQVRELLALEGIYEELPALIAPRRERARTAAEAVLAFDPQTEIGPTDPWFVDLRSLSPELRRFSDRLRAVIRRRDTHSRVVVLQRRGSGADTMIRRILHESRSTGVFAVTVRAPTPERLARGGFSSLLLWTIQAILEECHSHSEIRLPGEFLVNLRRWLARSLPPGEHSDYLLVSSNIDEHVTISAVISLIRRLTDPERAGEFSEQFGSVREEPQSPLDHLCGLVEGVQTQLAGRGSTVCLHFKGLDRLTEPAQIEELVLTRIDDFVRIPCHFVLSLDIAASDAFAVNDACTVLAFPRIASFGLQSNASAIARVLLGKRADLVSVFDDPDARVTQIVRGAMGHPGSIFALAQNACARAGVSRVAAEDVEETRRRGASDLSANQSGIDLVAYCQTVQAETGSLRIFGISSRAGRTGSEARIAIEDLYTQLRAHSGRDGRGERIAPADLAEILPANRYLLIEGPPGSGKTTFLKLVASVLARDFLAEPGWNGWSRRALQLSPGVSGKLPVFLRLWTLVPARAAGEPLLAANRVLHTLSERTADATGDTSRALRVRMEAWDSLLRAGEAMFLFDSLDEIIDPELRAQAFRAIEEILRTWPDCRVVVSSREIGSEPLAALGFARVTIAPFGPDEIEQFVTNWSTALFDGNGERGRVHAQSLLAAIRSLPELRHLATNPVILTCLCVIHWNEGSMPGGRARVYRAIITWMISARRAPRQQWGFTDTFAENALAALALTMMCHPEGTQVHFNVSEAAAAIEDEVSRHLPQFSKDVQRRASTDRGRTQVAREWLHLECEWSHIIEEISGDRLRFWHLGLQEFLAALALSWRDDDEGPESWWQIVRARLDDPQWRETLELLPACLYDEGGQRRVDQLIDRVLKLATPGDLVSEAWALGIAGGMSASMSVYAYSPRPHLATALLKLRVGVMAIFDRGRAEEVPLKVRIAAAEALGRAGDPRLAADNFISVPGTNVEMGRYPVTVGEFARFVEDDKGYLTTHWWDTRGWHWRETWGRTQPMEWDQQTKLPNRPVTYVSWWEARAYCRWLAYLLAREIRLPTAGEWETAATPQGGEYPWGTSKPDEELANFHKAVGGPTPVGLYPAGAGRYGHLDLAGNVREWCNDGPENSGDVRWLKGGSWADDGGALAVRCRMVGPCSRSDGDGGFRVVVTPASK